MGDFRGKRAELGMYDDIWICGDNAQEFIVPPSQSIHDKLTAEQWDKLIDAFNSISCTSFALTSEQIKLLTNDISKEK